VQTRGIPHGQSHVLAVEQLVEVWHRMAVVGCLVGVMKSVSK